MASWGLNPDYSRAICCESLSASVDCVRLCDSFLNAILSSTNGTIRLRKNRLPSLAPEPYEAEHLRTLATIFMNHPGLRKTTIMTADTALAKSR